MWVFGYGSLVWKVDFEYECKVVGYIMGYHRRFYQHSIDHRGVPEKPGRVVTLVPSDNQESMVWGIAYKIRDEDIERVTNYLDYREKNGYSKECVTFYPGDGNIQPFDLTFYVATSDNESFAGTASIEDIAKQIISCHGPSGANKDYVYNLAEAMRRLAPNVTDDHLFSLEAAVRRLDEYVEMNVVNFPKTDKHQIIFLCKISKCYSKISKKYVKLTCKLAIERSHKHKITSHQC